ncbi:MAG: malto-oligosyltrehalose trehalohydrolase [Chlamydiales bacterium]|nr:malto-oligosyltrehalose trehalohydrolase [Chlamydiales bacterium]
MPGARRYPIGAELVPGGTSFRVWAPNCKKVAVVHEGGESQKFYELKSEPKGYFSGTADLKAGDLYRFRLDDDPQFYADPASRFQPDGPFGPSMVVDPSTYEWKDQEWPGITIEGQILYEMHVGTFTQEGTFAAAARELEELAKLGITCIEMMPLHEFPGRFGWGYDGVNLFAPTRLYGKPDDVRAFIDAAHKEGIAVVLDVVYNHFGPRGNFIDKFSKDYVLEEEIEWGKAINFDNPHSREFFLTNVKYWLQEFHFDGYRVDATQAFRSTTPMHILEELCNVAHEAAGSKNIIVIGENEPQKSIIIRPQEKGGYGFDALWNDDFHHSAMVRLTGRSEAYYTDYRGTPQEFISCLKYGFLYQGQYYTWQKAPRGTPCLDLDPCSFILFVQNHDQVANSAHGKRVSSLTDPGNLKAMSALFILGPGIPMIFQGQEFASSAPFFYFADYEEDLSKLVEGGRREFLSQFENLATEEVQSNIPDPADPITFTQCKLNFKERVDNPFMYDLYKDLIAFKRTDVLLRRNARKMDGVVLSNHAFALRFFDDEEHLDRLMLFNFDVDFIFNPLGDPLVAPVEGYDWEMIWSTESPKYGGQGAQPLTEVWKIPGHSAMILTTVKKVEKPPEKEV